MSSIFGGLHAEEYQAMLDALHSCAEEEGESVRGFLNRNPETSLTVFLVNALHSKVYHIKKERSEYVKKLERDIQEWGKKRRERGDTASRPLGEMGI